jgi:hypothetical protein
MMSIKKIPNEVIKNFEEHYKENVLQPITTQNIHGQFVTYIYSLSSAREGKDYYKRACEIKTTDEDYYFLSKYGMVFMEFPNEPNKTHFRYDYIYYDEYGMIEYNTFVKSNNTNGPDYVAKLYKDLKNPQLTSKAMSMPVLQWKLRILTKEVAESK